MRANLEQERRVNIREDDYEISEVRANLEQERRLNIREKNVTRRSGGES